MLAGHAHGHSLLYSRRTRGSSHRGARPRQARGSGSEWPWAWPRSEEHTSELQSRRDLVCRLLLEKKKKKKERTNNTLIKSNKSLINDFLHIYTIRCSRSYIYRFGCLLLCIRSFMSVIHLITYIHE